MPLAPARPAGTASPAPPPFLLDPRLLRHARQTAVYIAVLVALGAAAAGLVIAQAQLLSGAIAGAVDHGATLTSLRGIVIALAAVLAGRALIAWATEAASYRASAAVKSQLRRQVLARAAALGPRWLAGRRTAELTELATEGIDALDGYFSSYLPQLILAVIVPLAVLIGSSRPTRCRRHDPGHAAAGPGVRRAGRHGHAATPGGGGWPWPGSPTTSWTWWPGCPR